MPITMGDLDCIRSASYGPIHTPYPYIWREVLGCQDETRKHKHRRENLAWTSIKVTYWKKASDHLQKQSLKEVDIFA